MKHRTSTFSFVAITTCIWNQRVILSFPTGTSIFPPSAATSGRNLHTHPHTSTMMSWQPLDPAKLEEETLWQTNERQPRMAKDTDYAVAVLEAWKAEEQQQHSGKKAWSTEFKPVTYFATEGETVVSLSGTALRRQGVTQTSPGILLFHTAAGPHDVFLLWKAASLVNSLDVPVVVFIADILSDDSGWGWDSDRSRYNTERNHVLQVRHGGRPVLQGRIQAAVDTMITIEHVDAGRLAALGWCFGGYSILESGRMHVAGMRAMVTYHGVFGNDSGQLPNGEAIDRSNPRLDILICHGIQDPFVASEDLEQALDLFQRHGHRVSLLQLQDAKHGFTNPAQEFNLNKDAFAFHRESADKAWRQTLALLKRTLVS